MHMQMVAAPSMLLWHKGLTKQADAVAEPAWYCASATLMRSNGGTLCLVGKGMHMCLPKQVKPSTSGIDQSSKLLSGRGNGLITHIQKCAADPRDPSLSAFQTLGRPALCMQQTPTAGLITAESTMSTDTSQSMAVTLHCCRLLQETIPPSRPPPPTLTGFSGYLLV